jgi:hypothetical protein
MGLLERALNLLSLKFVSDVLIGAPEYLTSEFIKVNKVSLPIRIYDLVLARFRAVVVTSFADVKCRLCLRLYIHPTYCGVVGAVLGRLGGLI